MEARKENERLEVARIVAAPPQTYRDNSRARPRLESCVQNVGEKDILFGVEGLVGDRHEANARFQMLLAYNAAFFESCGHAKRRILAASIVQAYGSEEPSVRFLFQKADGSCVKLSHDETIQEVVTLLGGQTTIGPPLKSSRPLIVHAEESPADLSEEGWHELVKSKFLPPFAFS